MTRLMMLDSGAFSVAHAGAAVDLDAYIEFCLAHPDCSYYVNLDVIPVRKRWGERKGLTIEEACRESFNNYKRMTRSLPIGRVIPVFHRSDSELRGLRVAHSDPIKWLDKYLDLGCPYVGLAPGHNTDVAIKKLWLRELRPKLFDGAGRPNVKLHGFAVTSFDLMKYWEWESVDSSSWKLQGAWGGIYTPATNSQKEFDFSQTPVQFGMSPRAPALRDKRGHHFDNCAADARERVLRWLKIAGVPVGTWETKQVNDSYKLSREREEVWYDKAKRVVLVPIEKGVTTAVEERLRVNAEFIKRANRALPTVRHIYFAGALMPYPLEYQLGRRLLSFAHLRGKAAKRRFEKHMALIRQRKQRRTIR